jgi:dipeptidyl aminopeptidase/acylaminoacyl peptidase
VRWSPSGAHIAVTAEKEWQTDGTFVVPLDGSPAQRIGGSEDPIDAYLPAWSPDGSKLAFCSHSPGWTEMGIYDLRSARIDWLTNDKSDHLNPFWSQDGTRICWVNVHSETAHIEIFDLTTRTSSRIPTGSGFCHLPLLSPNGESVFFLFEDPFHPPDIWQARLADGALTQLTNCLPSGFDKNDFPMPEVVHYPSFDETLIPALLYKPRNAGPHSPGVLLIHGGPTWHIGFYWNPIMSYYTSRGWTVIAPNYRGSTGYGREWQVSNRFELGRLDSDDCAASVRYLVSQKLADPKKIAVTGRSHGGYLTMTCLTRNPDLFAVGSAVVPFLNWFTGHENSREDLQYWDICNMGDPQEYHDLWYERSPFFFLDRVRAPVQLIAGGNDMRCPPSESTLTHEKLVEYGIESELLLYEDEGHGFLKLENVIDSDVKRAEFLAKVLDQ